MSDIHYSGAPDDIDIGAIARAVARLDAFRDAAQDITTRIQSQTSQDLCKDLTHISVQQYIFLTYPVPEHVRVTAIAAAQKAVSKVVEESGEKFLKNPALVAQAGLVDFESDPLYPEGTERAVYESITPEFAADVARSGTLTLLNDELHETIRYVIHDEDDDMPFSYDGLSNVEQRALYKAFIHAAHAAMQICRETSEPNFNRIHNHLEKLEVAAS